jgi:glucosyl-dolichyl phosphate glucuronosyltransferase
VTTFSVVICAHDGKRWNDLRAAVRSVRQQTLRAHEVVVVVDRNRPLLERAQAELEDVIVVENSETPGLGGARNSGIAASTAPLVAFLDDDAVASPSWLEHLAEPYADVDVAGVGGAIEPRWEVGRPAWFPMEFDWVVGCTYRGMPDTQAEVRNLIGCNMSYRREVLEALGRFRLGYGCDETELCIRLRQQWPEKKLIYAPDASVSHFVPRSRTRLSRFLWRCYFEGGSKAVVSRLVGSQQGLASERHYVRRTLPPGVLGGLKLFVHDRDASGVFRAAVIVLGFLATCAGYVRARLSLTESARRRGWSGGRLDRQVR